jgi:hypothetical protein
MERAKHEQPFVVAAMYEERSKKPTRFISHPERFWNIKIYEFEIRI